MAEALQWVVPPRRASDAERARWPEERIMMTRTTFTLLVAGALAGAAAPASAQRWDRDREPRDGVCVYKDADFRGARLCLGAGDDLRSIPAGLNDEISSIRVFGRAVVTVFRDRDFRGRATRFDFDVRDLQDERWNDRVSSIRVESRRAGYRPGDRDRDRDGGRYGERDADQIVRRAYRAVLERDPDPDGLRVYTRRVVRDGWSEADVREALRDSPEYRERATMTWPRAQEVVRRAYLAVLRREPDPASRGYVEKVLREGWTQQDVERELRRSDEYRRRR
jgi:hypothetical protein